MVRVFGVSVQLLIGAAFIVVTTFLVIVATAQSIFASQIQWSEPTLVNLVDNQHGRIMIFGKADPETKIELQPGALSIDSPTTVHDLTTNDMEPSPKEIAVSSDGHFAMLLTLPFTHVQIPFKATMVGRHDQIYILTILVRKDQPPMLISKESNKLKYSRWNIGLEARQVTFSQTNLNTLYETMLALDITYERELTNRWFFQANTFVDIAGNAPFSTSQELPSRYWHLSSDLIYLLPNRSPKWAIGIAGGLYYMTMFSSGTSFGYSDLWGPELYPIVKYSLDNSDAFDFYLKYSPNASNFSPNFSDHEAAAGVGWMRLHSNQRSVTFKVELLQDEYNKGGESTESTAINFGVLFGFP